MNASLLRKHYEFASLDIFVSHRFVCVFLYWEYLILPSNRDSHHGLGALDGVSAGLHDRDLVRDFDLLHDHPGDLDCNFTRLHRHLLTQKHRQGGKTAGKSM